MAYNELYHHGILGMKWGVRRYQNLDGSRTPLGKKRYGVWPPKENDTSYKVLKKQAKTERSRAKDEAKEARKTADFEEFKDKLVRSGSAKDVYKYRNQLTRQEREEAISRLEQEQRIANISGLNRKLVRSGNAKKLYENRRLLSNQEMDEALRRIEQEKKLKDLSTRHVKTGKERLKDLVDTSKSVAEISKNMSTTAQSWAKLYNLSTDYKKKHYFDSALDDEEKKKK